MIYSPDANQFVLSNLETLRRMAGSLLRPPFDDDRITDLIADLVLDLHRLKLLEKYTPERLSEYGVSMSTVIVRQMRNILNDRTRYKRALKRSPNSSLLPVVTSYGSDHLIERIAVREFMTGLKPHLYEILEAKMSGYTGSEFCRSRSMAAVTGEKRMAKIRSKWSQYCKIPVFS